MGIINEKFSQNPDLKEWQGYRELNGVIVIKPINLLASYVHEISIGNSDVEIDISGKDEISELAKGFDRMNTSIQLAMSKLKK